MERKRAGETLTSEEEKEIKDEPEMREELEIKDEL